MLVYLLEQDSASLGKVTMRSLMTVFAGIFLVHICIKYFYLYAVNKNIRGLIIS